jgi:antitoxin (DNA-binding transcriptional repressor) of toxin-antitoxin stability system
MSAITVTSEQARVNWRDTIDTAYKGGEVVIERYGKPMVAVVNFDLWRRMRRQWVAMLEQRLAEMDAGEYVTQEELDAELKARGILE